MIYDKYREEVWETIRSDVGRLEPLARLLGFDPPCWDDVEGVAVSLAQVEWIGDMPYYERYDGPLYELRDAAQRIIDALDECSSKHECESKGFDCRAEGFCVCQAPNDLQS